VEGRVALKLLLPRGGFKEWPLGQWLTRPSQDEKKEAIWLNAFLMKLFLLLKELLSIAHFISHEFDISSFSA